MARGCMGGLAIFSPLTRVSFGSKLLSESSAMDMIALRSYYRRSWSLWFEHGRISLVSFILFLSLLENLAESYVTLIINY